MHFIQSTKSEKNLYFLQKTGDAVSTAAAGQSAKNALFALFTYFLSVQSTEHRKKLRVLLTKSVIWPKLWAKSAL